MGVFALAVALLVAADPPGTPKPAVGAPADKPGRNDPFGSQGEKAEEVQSQAESVAKEVKPRIDRIHIVGNTETSDEQILAHLDVHEGDELDDAKVLQSRARLLQLGGFEQVHAGVVYSENGRHVTLVIRVVEKNRYYITDTLYGSTRTTKFYAGLGLAAANLFGSGLSLSTVGIYGSGNRYGWKVTAYFPDLNVHGISFVTGVQLLGQRNRENACGLPDCWASGQTLEYARNGGELNFGFRVGLYQRFVFGYRLEFINAGFNEEGVDAALAPFIRTGTSRMSALDFAFDRDARDEVFLPTRGNRVQAEVRLASRAIGSSYEYARFLAQYEQWVPQGGGRALRLDVALGLVQGEAPFYERFYAADWSYFALGLATSRLLDMNFSPDPRYDAVVAVAGGEYDFPLWQTPHLFNFMKRGYLAVGGRFVYTAATPGGARTPVSKIPFSADASIRLDTPAGVLSVSLGYIADLIF